MPKISIIDGEPNINLQEISIEKNILSPLGEINVEVVPEEVALSAKVFDSDVIILWHQLQITRITINKLHRCRGIIRTGVGYDNVDIQTCGQKQIPVFNIPDYGIGEVADHTLAMILGLLRKLKVYNRYIAQASWDWRVAAPIRRLSELTLGIVGCGRIGSEVIRRAKGFGFRIIFFDPYLPVVIEKSLGVRRVDSLEHLLRMADILSLHVPLTQETRHMISKAQFSLMKLGSILVNTARGSVVDNEALLDALQNEKLAGAGLDVLEGEPQVPLALRGHEKVILTPHAAFYSEESLVDLRRKSAELARVVLLKAPMPEPVNKEFLSYAR